MAERIDISGINLKKQDKQKTVKENEKPKLIKVTFYLNREDNVKLESVKFKLKEQGEDKNKSELIQEAIGLLSEKYTSKTA
jgi:uncharacterized protein YndB with AHSA1/START domain